MTDQTCRCGKPTAGTKLCDRCVKTLEKALGNASAYYADLETVRTRQTRYGSGTASKGTVGKSQPIGMDVRFEAGGRGAQLQAAARNAVVTWARAALEEWPPLTWAGPVCRSCWHSSCIDYRRRAHPRDTVPAVCGYLQGLIRRIAGQDWAPELLDDMLELERSLRRFVDRPADRWYAGICGSVTPYDDGTEVRCERELYAEPGAVFVRCGDCGCTYDVPARREALLREAEDREATVEVIARIVTTLGDVKVSRERIASRITTWANRGRITPHGSRVVDGKVRPTYRVGDVLDRLAADARSESA